LEEAKMLFQEEVLIRSNVLGAENALVEKAQRENFTLLTVTT
jgi:hypothetical protein